MESKFATSAFAFNVLDGDNYFDWSIRVKFKLMDQDLWDIVEETEEPIKAENDEAASMAWAKKNAMALKVIQNLCMPRLCAAIKLISSAKIAWDTLAEICNLPKSGYMVYKEETYEVWSDRMKTYLIDHKLWDIVEGTIEPPTREDDKMAFNDWNMKNALALNLIWESSKEFHLICNCSTAKMAWDGLAESHNLNRVVDKVLDGDNYSGWKHQVQSYLYAKDLWDVVEATDEPPKEENEKDAFKTWTKKNGRALLVIQNTCGPRFCAAIKLITSAKIAWDALAFICHLPKYDYIAPYDESFEVWSYRMNTYMRTLDLWGIVEATTEPPTAEDDKIRFNDWSKKNTVALYLIWESSKLFHLICDCSTAKLAWDGLGKLHNIKQAITQFLHGDNYVYWSSQVKSYLIAEDLWVIIETTDEPPQEENDEDAFKAWTKKNAMALIVIKSTCTPPLFAAISLISSAKFAWDALAKICDLPQSCYKVPKEESYEVWSARIETYLRDEDLWDTVEATIEPPTTVDEQITYNDWIVKNALALYLIWKSSNLFHLICNCSTAKMAWDKLAELHKLHEAVPNVLDGNNYLVWSHQVKTYLIDQELWDIVEATGHPFEAENYDAMTLINKNAKALQVIQTLCEPRLFAAISFTTSAENAWNTLAEMCNNPKKVLT